MGAMESGSDNVGGYLALYCCIDQWSDSGTSFMH